MAALHSGFVASALPEPRATRTPVPSLSRLKAKKENAERMKRKSKSAIKNAGRLSVLKKKETKEKEKGSMPSSKPKTRAGTKTSPRLSTAYASARSSLSANLMRAREAMDRVATRKAERAAEAARRAKDRKVPLGGRSTKSSRLRASLSPPANVTISSSSGRSSRTASIPRGTNLRRTHGDAVRLSRSNRRKTSPRASRPRQTKSAGVRRRCFPTRSPPAATPSSCTDAFAAAPGAVSSSAPPSSSSSRTKASPEASGSPPERAQTAEEEQLEKLHLLQATLLQWRVINANAEEAFAAQKAKAKSDMTALWHHIEQRRQEAAELRLRLEQRQHRQNVARVIAAQDQALQRIEREVDAFAPANDALLNVLRGRLSYVPVAEGVKVDPVRLMAALDRVARVGKTLCETREEKGDCEASAMRHLGSVAEAARAASELDQVIDATTSQLSRWGDHIARVRACRPSEIQ